MRKGVRGREWEKDIDEAVVITLRPKTPAGRRGVRKLHASVILRIAGYALCMGCPSNEYNASRISGSFEETPR